MVVSSCVCVHARARLCLQSNFPTDMLTFSCGVGCCFIWRWVWRTVRKSGDSRKIRESSSGKEPALVSAGRLCYLARGI